MKKLTTAISLILAVLLLSTSCANLKKNQYNGDESVMDTTKENEVTEITKTEQTTLPEINAETLVSPFNYEDMRAMWLSQFDLTNVYCKNGTQRPKAEFSLYLKQILRNVKSVGINTVIVQMRPNADSMYPSAVYPPSEYVVGEYGKEFTYDPIELLIDMAHEQKLSVHAWINPMRCMSESGIAKIPDSYVLKKWYADKNGFVQVVDGKCYLDPAYKEVRNLICEGVTEIMEKYPIDGIHMDDYFYPTTSSSFDNQSYKLYKENGGTLDLGDFRRNNVNILVKELYNTVNAKNEDILFGISPAGNNDSNYSRLYADVSAWCTENPYVDYICPQAYFGFKHSTYSFTKVISDFKKVIKSDKVRLIVGMTLGKAVHGYNGVEDKYAGAGKREWIENKDVLKRCVEYVYNDRKCSGVAFFCYQYFFDPVSGVERRETKIERDNFVPLLQKKKDILAK